MAGTAGQCQLRTWLAPRDRMKRGSCFYALKVTENADPSVRDWSTIGPSSHSAVRAQAWALPRTGDAWSRANGRKH
jgi:hypothetical protein